VNQWGAVAGSGFDGNVAWFRDWGKANGVKVTLCVVNHVGGWNWAEAKRSFADNRAAFANSLVAEADRLGLDGVDLDLEGPVSPTRDDSVQYLAFTRELSGKLKAKGKVLNVATYCAQYNAPNWNWWRELMTHVDAVTSMGYDEAGMNNPAGWKYPEQKKRASPASKLMIGMFGSSESWQGNSASQQIDYVVNDGQLGLAIWDANLRSSTWLSGDTWRKIRTIKNNSPNPIAGKNRARGLEGMLSVRSASAGLFADLVLTESSRVRVRIVDAQGAEVSELFRGRHDKGRLSLHWPGVSPAGIPAARGAYVLVAETGGKADSRPFILAP
jgi:GH18 family chitinase